MTASTDRDNSPRSVSCEIGSGLRLRVGVVDRGRAVTWDPVSRGRFRAVGFVASGRSVRGAGFLLPGALWRDVEGDFSAAGRLGGNGRLRGSRPEAAPAGGVDFFEV
jgi:hypothetical protein